MQNQNLLSIAPSNLSSADATTDSIRERPRPRHILIVAGEASGDMHGADLVREILARDPGCELWDRRTANARRGSTRTIRAEDVAGLGSPNWPPPFAHRGRDAGLRAILRDETPSLLILIDFAEFNMMLAGIGNRAACPCSITSLPRYGHGGAAVSGN